MGGAVVHKANKTARLSFANGMNRSPLGVFVSEGTGLTLATPVLFIFDDWIHKVGLSVLQVGVVRSLFVQKKDCFGGMHKRQKSTFFCVCPFFPVG